MKRIQAREFHPELLKLYDRYVHGQITKRGFLDAAGKFAIGGVTASALLESLQPNYALARQVSEDDPDIVGERITYDSPNGHGEIMAYQVKPAGLTTSGPAVLVVHENRGLNPYIADVARRVAKAGFTALAPDGLSPLGGYPGNDDDGRAMQKELDREKLLRDFFAAYEHLAGRSDVNGKIGAVGFCYGGGVCNALAVTYPQLSASVPFYGRQASAADVPRIQAPLLLHYAGLDERINAGWPDYEAALQEHGKTYTAHIYPDVNHGFHNDTTPRYDEAAAKLAWNRTVGFFEQHLS